MICRYAKKAKLAIKKGVGRRSPPMLRRAALLKLVDAARGMSRKSPRGVPRLSSIKPQ
jgi:hypothetical protein